MITKRITNIFRSTDARSKNVKNNILLSLLLKGVNVLCSLVVVPLTLGYLTKEEYGVWLIISTILTWISFFDIGLSNGLRNYLTEAISLKRLDLGKIYLSTTLFLLLVIVGVFSLILVVVVPLLDWNAILNTQKITPSTLSLVVFVAIFISLINFVVKNVGIVYISLQKYAMNDFLHSLGNILSLLAIWVLTMTTVDSLLLVVLVFTLSPVIVFILAAIPLFYKHSELIPTVKSIQLQYSRQLMMKSGGFFVIQLTTVLVIYGSSNFFITQICGPESVAVYNTAYRYFSVSTMGFTTIIAPLWNAYTDAYVKGDMKWIKATYSKTITIWLMTTFLGLFMLIVSPYVYDIWIGEKLDIPFSISLTVFIYFSFLNLNTCASYLLNGLNKIRVQVVSAVLVTAMYVVVVFPLGKRFGTEGVVLGMIIAFFILASLRLYQVHLILTNKAQGIWAK